MTDGIVGRGRGLPARRRGPPVDGAAAIAPDLPRLRAEEGVAGPALATDQGLEQKGKRRPRYLDEGGERGVAVEDDFPHHGDHPAPAPFSRELGAGEEVGTRVAHLARIGVHRECRCASGSWPSACSLVHGPCPRRRGIPKARSRWHVVPCCGGAARRLIPRSTTTKPRRTASSSFSVRSAKGSLILPGSSRPTSWSWKCTGGHRRAASSV